MQIGFEPMLLGLQPSPYPLGHCIMLDSTDHWNDRIPRRSSGVLGSCLHLLAPAERIERSSCG